MAQDKMARVSDCLAYVENRELLDETLDTFPNGLPYGLTLADCVCRRRITLLPNGARSVARRALPYAYRSPVS